jgi:hypothetical protein
MLRLYIPSENFEAGGCFEGKPPLNTQVILRMTGPKWTYVKNHPQIMEDWEFQPDDTAEYASLLQEVKNKRIIIERDGVVQTPAQMTALFREQFQEL